DGAPVADLTITAYGSGSAWRDTRSDDNGAFVFTAAGAGLGPGHYRVVALDGRWSIERGQAEVDVAEGERGEVEIVVDGNGGIIRGRVVDDGGTAIDDAFISLERQGERLEGPALRGRLNYSDNKGRPVLTDSDGSFEIGDLPDGLYIVRAQQRQGGEAVRNNVAVGSKVELVIDAVSTMAGTVVLEGSNEPVAAFEIQAKLGDGSFETDDQWLDGDGRWRFEDMPPGHYALEVDSPSGDGSLEFDLAPGTVRDDLRIVLKPRVLVRGRLVGAVSKEPIANARIRARDPEGISFGPGSVAWSRSGEDGSFEFSAAVGKRLLEVIPAGSVDGRRHDSLTKELEIVGGQPLELGDLALEPRAGDAEE
ncbi:MAG: carboxypeptidase regulatory-like domain-containing protein, partial [Myxococcales bacterium]|nr:carboxypeptidase regulatory-like domain-containing protein [Myxococcales bacterium]